MSTSERNILMGLFTTIILVGLIALFLFQSRANQQVYEGARLTERYYIETTNQAIVDKNATARARP